MPTHLILPGRISPLKRLNRLLKSSPYQDAKFLLLVDENTSELCMPLLLSEVEAFQEAEFLVIPVGEKSKSLEIAGEIWDSFLSEQADRNMVIVNLGGGCVSDLGGFVAAGFKRGIRYINVPTTLVGMVDAAVGGKTAINRGNFKNQIGFFYPPEIVCVNPAFLNTLPHQEMLSGLFEMKKTALLSGQEVLFQKDCYDDSKKQIFDSAIPTVDSISQCVKFKMDVCKADPFDKGVRKILNFGHTFGHAIESFSLFSLSPYSHGMAVGLGMWCELYLSVQKMGFPPECLKAYEGFLRQWANEIPSYQLKDTKTLLAFMQQDKKNIDGTIRCVLLQDIALPVIDVPISELEACDALMKLGKLGA